MNIIVKIKRNILTYPTHRYMIGIIGLLVVLVIIA